MSSVSEISPHLTMQQVLDLYPGAQRALFRRYHIGGCSSCAFEAGETLAELCARHSQLDVTEVIDHLKSSREQDEAVMIDPSDVSSLQKGNRAPMLLDVRTREEWEAVRIDGSVRMSQETMKEILGYWDREGLLVIYDHQGKTSLDAAAYFMGQGFKNVRCLRGGIDAWAKDVQPQMPRYRLEQTTP